MPLLGQASFSVAVGYDCSVCKHMAFLGTPVCSLVKSVSISHEPKVYSWFLRFWQTEMQFA